MPLKNYGLLTGKLVSHGPQHGGNPHYLLVIEAGGIQYRVAVNLQSTLPAGDAPSELQYQIVNNLAEKLKEKKMQIPNQNAFVLRDSDPNGLSLDFVHDGLLDMSAFKQLAAGSDPQKNAFANALKSAAIKAARGTDSVAPTAAAGADSYVAVFGTGYPDQDDRPPGRAGNPIRASLGFTGVDNVHMNQGSYYRIGQHIDPYFKENGPNQDGAVIFFFDDETVVGFFTKFDSQDSETDEFGNPAHTGIKDLDSEKKISTAARANVLKDRVPTKKLLRHLKVNREKAPITGTAAASNPVSTQSTRREPQATPAGSATSGTSGGTAAGSLNFGDTATVVDPNRPFAPNDDDQYFNSPFVNNFATYGTPEPVPSPRNGITPLLKLEQIIGATKVASIVNSGKIVFHAVGDTGAVVESQYGKEQSVADLMLQDFSQRASPNDPSFFFHLGDVVYYYGEQEFYYDQFYHPYKDYPAPIVAIPGNHDGITHPNGADSLAGFISAFCDDVPRYWPASGGIKRTTMIQPGVFFTMEAPFVSIIGLYSNCDETFGYLDDQQKLFLLSELQRLKPLREKGTINAVILAVHHCPMSFSASKPASVTMRDDIDNACKQADFWPDAVLSGHAHVYQRMTRTVPIGGTDWQIPHLIAGSGGYGNKVTQEVNKKDMKTQDTSDPEFRLHNFMMGYGYLLVTVTPASDNAPSMLRIDFHSPGLNNGLPADGCVLNLDTHQLM